MYGQRETTDSGAVRAGGARPAGPSPERLQEAVFRKLDRHTTVEGRLIFPCLPALLETTLARLDATLAVLGRPLSEAQRAEVRALLAGQLDAGFRSSPHSLVALSYGPADEPKKGLAFQVTLAPSTLADRYSRWVEVREPPFFGLRPDAMLLDTLDRLGLPPAAVPVLDVGAGTGRNALPLARRDHPVDAVELTPAFAWQLRASAEAEGLPVRVIEGNALAPSVALPAATYRLALMLEMTSHLRGVKQLAFLLRKVCDSLAAGGLLLFNAFVAEPGYTPVDLDRQHAEYAFSSFFTRAELDGALAGLPLTRLLEEPACAYERERCPPDAWPPTKWFESWATGHDAFPVDDPPIALVWFLFRRDD